MLGLLIFKQMNGNSGNSTKYKVKSGATTLKQSDRTQALLTTCFAGNIKKPAEY
jgi:hypothetical protein